MLCKPGTERWDVYGDLCSRDHLIYGRCELPKGILGVYMPDRPKSLIMVSSAANECMQEMATGHELLHDEEGGGCILEGMPAQWLAIAAREERRIDLEVARRKMPKAELLGLVEFAGDNRLPLEPWHIAEHFDVPQYYADLRCSVVDLSVRKAS